jgi:hypothetical protein
MTGQVNRSVKRGARVAARETKFNMVVMVLCDDDKK